MTRTSSAGTGMTVEQHESRAWSAKLATNAELAEQKLSVPEVAKILGISKMTVYRLLHPEDGLPPVLRSYRVGPRGMFRVPISAVRAYLAYAASDNWEEE